MSTYEAFTAPLISPRPDPTLRLGGRIRRRYCWSWMGLHLQAAEVPGDNGRATLRGAAATRRNRKQAATPAFGAGARHARNHPRASLSASLSA